jgi:hypothetical protein
VYLLDKSTGPKTPKTATKPITRDIKGLIAWLTLQDPSRIYEYYDTKGGCLLSQFVVGGCGGTYVNSREYHTFLGGSVAMALDRYVTSPRPWTYGDALYRARANEWRFLESN